MADKETSPGFYVPDESDLMERYQAYHDDHKRSEAIRNALELQMVVEDAFENAPWTFDSERDKRANVRQAILDLIEKELEEADE